MFFNLRKFTRVTSGLHVQSFQITFHKTSPFPEARYGWHQDMWCLVDDYFCICTYMGAFVCHCTLLGVSTSFYIKGRAPLRCRDRLPIFSFSILQTGFPLLGHLSMVSSSTFCFWWLRWRPGEGMWHYYQYHSGFLTKVFCVMTCISAEAMVLLTTLQSRSCELLPYMGLWKRFHSHGSGWKWKLGGGSAWLTSVCIRILL